jgi:hypothetical protein
MFLSAATILVLFAYSQEHIAKSPASWSPFAGVEALAQD